MSRAFCSGKILIYWQTEWISMIQLALSCMHLRVPVWFYAIQQWSCSGLASFCTSHPDHRRKLLVHQVLVAGPWVAEQQTGTQHSQSHKCNSINTAAGRPYGFHRQYDASQTSAVSAVKRRQTVLAVPDRSRRSEHQMQSSSHS